MKSIKASLLLIVLHITSYGQLDVHQFKKIQFGAMYDKTTVTGLYTLVNPYTNDIMYDIQDYRTTINAEIKFIHANDDFVVTANLEGFAYLLGRLASLGKKEELFYDFDTYLDPLSAGDCQKIKFFSGPQYNEVARFSNNHIFDITTSKPIKEGPLFVGINASLRTLGFPPRYTYYPTETPSGYYASSQMAGTWKILYGLNAGYRQNFGKHLAMFLISGINTGVNKKGSTAIQVKYSPFVNPTIFIGGKYGCYVGFYWEMIKGKDKTTTLTTDYLIGGNLNPVTKTVDLKMEESQILLKLGFYLTSKRENN